MTGVVEQVGIGVERDRGASVTQDPADLRHVELEVDDQVAGKCVAEVMHPEPR